MLSGDNRFKKADLDFIHSIHFEMFLKQIRFMFILPQIFTKKKLFLPIIFIITVFVDLAVNYEFHISHLN